MRALRPVSGVALAIVLAASVAAAQKLGPEELVRRHAEQALGAAGAAPGRNLRGTARMTTTIMGAGNLDGTMEMTSAQESSRLVLRFGNEGYEGESIAFDGKEVEVGFAQPRRSMRSALGLFLSVNRVVVREGLLGGVLNARWPLRDLAAREAKVSSDGMKKLDGRDLHRLRYRARRDQGDLTIHLYFEPDTYRHVATVYSSSRAQGLGATIETSSRQSDQYFTLEERFSDFDAPLPRTWVVRYSRSGNTTTEWKYEMKVQQAGS